MKSQRKEFTFPDGPKYTIRINHIEGGFSYSEIKTVDKQAAIMWASEKMVELLQKTGAFGPNSKLIVTAYIEE